MASKWNGKRCHLRGAGTLHDGVKTIAQEYKGTVLARKPAGRSATTARMALSNSTRLKKPLGWPFVTGWMPQKQPN
jgi:hypothetical protein